MAPRENTEELFRDPRRKRIHERLLLIGEGPAAFYRDVCRILDAEVGLPPEVVRGQSEQLGDVQNPPMQLAAATHIVSHLFRDIESAIRQVLVPAGPKDDPSQGHSSEIDAILNAYELREDTTLVEAWHRLAGNSESSLHKRAHRNNLARPRTLDNSSRRYFSDVEAVFDAVLGRFEEQFPETLKVVDALLAKHPPTKTDLKTLRNKVPNNLITLHHFFSNVTDPTWLNLLDESGTFATPPEPMLDEEDDAALMQPWPAGQYLARMAAIPELQERVAEIARAVPSTQNVRVHDNLADVALALPVPLALQFVDRATTWCRDPWFSRIADKIGALIELFLDADEVDAALQLAGALFDPENRPPEYFESGHEVSEYERSLQRLAPLLVEAGALNALDLLTSCLVRLLRGAEGSARIGSEEFSNGWRPAIEPNEQNPSHGWDARQAVIDAVRDGAEALCATDPSQVGVIVQHLEAAGSPVLDRIALHLLRVAPEVPVDLVASHLLDRNRLDSSNCWHEYTLLAHSRLGDLPRDAQSQIVQWEVEREAQWATEAMLGREVEVEEPETTDSRARAFEHRALDRFRGVLPEEFRNRHKQLEEEFGTAEHPEFLSYHTGARVGPTSPKASVELEALSVEELVEYLRTWIPEPGLMNPTREGLAHELSNLVAARPKLFAGTANSFRDLHRAYVRGLIGGLRSAAQNGVGFDWEPVLDLLAWVVKQGTPGQSSDELADASEKWAGTRSELAHLLERGFADGAQELPFECRVPAWALVEQLATDPDPRPELEAEHIRSNSSPYELAINTIRGTALTAAVTYGLWVRRHLAEPSPDFGSMPELRSLLGHHLNPSLDPSLAVRSTYGRLLPWIHLLAPGWTKEHLDEIFPAGSAQQDFRQAAWDAYILYCRPYSDVFHDLRDEYRHAVSQLKQRDDPSRRDTDKRTAEHLMVFYLRGQIDLQDELLAKFFERATEVTRQDAITFVGRVQYQNGDLDAQLKARAMALWESRTADLEVAAAERHLELAAFGWWFAANSLDAGWRLAQLERVLSRKPDVEADHLVFKEFVVLVKQHPISVLACVRRMIEGDSNHWKIFSWRHELHEILDTALDSENPEVVREARAIVGILVARGEVHYRALLGSSLAGA